MAYNESDYSLNLITAPANEPILLPDAKLWLKSPTNITTDDALITNLITLAREYVERYTKRALFTQTWEMVFSCMPSMINVPLGQLQSIDSVNIVNDDGTKTVQAATLYNTTLATDSGRIFLKSGSSWGTTDRDYDNFIVQFIAGWDDVDDIPEVYKTAIKKIIAYMYENREYNDKDVYLLCQQTGVGRLY